MLGEASGLYPHHSIASFAFKTNLDQTFCLCRKWLLLRSRSVAFVRPRRGRLVYIKSNCAQTLKILAQKPEANDDDDRQRYGWLCPVCDSPMVYVGVEDGGGDYGTSLCDIYKCTNCGEMIEGACIDTGSGW